MILTTAEPAGANCAAAGVKVELGLDSDRDGALAPTEVEAAATRFLCNGAQGLQGMTGATGADGPQGPAGPQGPLGLDGVSVLLKTSVEPAGLNCFTGGTKLEAGRDTSRDAVLDTSEVDAALTRFLCDGAQGAQGVQGPIGPTGLEGLSNLARTSAEAAGANCTTGGTRLESGSDANRNGTLDATEINAALTRYVCNGAQGPQGIQGAQGAQGAAGPEGLSSLARTTAEAAGANCATGGVRFEAGADANRNGTLDAAEINAALTRFVCNGAQGPQGIQGAMGPQGPAGALSAYGDGSAGALTVPVGNTLDLSNPAVVNGQPHRTNLQFTNISIAGNLLVPSGTILRATGDIAVSGTITVLTGARDTGPGPAHPGLALAAPGPITGGVGVSLLSAADLTRGRPFAGGSGEVGATGSGGEGGGALTLLARGNVTVFVGGAINANGGNGVNAGTTGDVGGPGGGAGGLIAVFSRGNITVGGALRANGGAGGAGLNLNGGVNGAGGGGGGAGGIIQLSSVNSTSVTGTLQANGGAAGADAFTGATSATAGGGGGALGGNGGNGGGSLVFGGPLNAASAGSAGHLIQRVIPAPENLF